MQINDKVKSVLEQLDLTGLEVKVEPSGGGRVVAEVVSTAFEHMPEEDRQELVWSKLLEGLDSGEQRLVEFVFTDAPSERNEVKR